MTFFVVRFVAYCVFSGFGTFTGRRAYLSHPTTRRRLMHLDKRWLPLVLSTGAAVALWTFAASRGYAWQMLWLPGAVAGAVWPRNRGQKRLCFRPARREPQ